MKKIIDSIYIKSWKRLNSFKLRKLETYDLNISFDDLFNSSDTRSTQYLMGFYSRNGIKYALQKYKIFKSLNEFGFRDIKLITDFENQYKQRIALYEDKILPQCLLAELVTQKKTAVVKSIGDNIVFDENLIFLSIEWLCLQNPYNLFCYEKPRLPGQMYPGLGLGKDILTILFLMNWQIGLNGLLNIPEYYHNAAMYSKRFSFIDPEKQAILNLLKNTIQQKWDMATLSWAIDRKFVLINNKKFKWFTSPQIIPSNKKLQFYLQSKQYAEKMTEHQNGIEFNLDIRGFIDSLEQTPIPGYSEFYLPRLKQMI